MATFSLSCFRFLQNVLPCQVSPDFLSDLSQTHNTQYTLCHGNRCADSTAHIHIHNMHTHGKL